MSKHTPGPWFINGTLGHAVCVVAQVRIAADKLPDSNTDADSRLIAAAPDLLEALKLADAMLSGANMNEKTVEQKVRAAIAKATGENV